MARDTYNPTQAGATIIFKDGVTPAQAEAALRKIRDVLESTPVVHQFDPRWGSPTFYVP